MRMRKRCVKNQTQEMKLSPFNDRRDFFSPHDKLTCDLPFCTVTILTEERFSCAPDFAHRPHLFPFFGESQEGERRCTLPWLRSTNVCMSRVCNRYMRAFVYLYIHTDAERKNDGRGRKVSEAA